MDSLIFEYNGMIIGGFRITRSRMKSSFSRLFYRKEYPELILILRKLEEISFELLVKI